MTPRIDRFPPLRIVKNFSFLFLALPTCFAVSPSHAAVDFRKDILPVLEDHCYDCHGEGAKKGDFTLDQYPSLEANLKDTNHWYAVWKNLSSQLMPPSDETQPTTEQRERVLRWIETTVFKLDPANPDPGRVTIRRLNREEYRNTIRDLLDYEFDTDEAFPEDDTGYGFDTIGDVLSISPLLLEKYVGAAGEIAEAVAGKAGGRIPTQSIEPDKFRLTNDPKKSAKLLPFADATTASYLKKIEFPGRYRISVDLRVSGSNEATTHSAKAALLVGGKPIEVQNLGWDYRKDLKLVGEADLTKGDNLLALEMIPGPPPPADENFLNLNVGKVRLQGPLDGSKLEYPPEYFRVFLDGPPPADAAARTVYARKILRQLADRAFRRPVDERTLDRLVAMAADAQKLPGANFERGIAQALTAILASPRFLFRAEIQAEPNNPGKIVPVDEFALASRLSYFLWNSLPDKELDELARKGQLRANLRAQVDRLLADERADRFVSSFVGQWLQTRDVEGVNIDSRRFLGVKDLGEAQKIFSQRLRRAMREETETLFAYLVKENRPATELLTADYTFLNETLAKYYKIPGVEGQEMRKVPLPADSPRRAGVLTHGSTLVVTSNPTRTSPVKRGLFILENILGTPAPPAPPNVPELEDTKKRGSNLTMREMMVVHREAPLCAGCHARMDPLGLALENFTPIASFRADERGKPIDTAGKLITGEKFQNITELAQVLATQRQSDFYHCLSEKLLTYAVGRGLEYYDTVTIEKIVDALKKDGGAMRTLIYSVIESAPFQKRRGDGDRVASSR
jgi:mono/diheme cytochrome c family protein